MDHFTHHSRAGNADKWTESVVRKGRRSCAEWAQEERGKKQDGGFQMGHAEEVDFRIGPTGHVWPNGKWQGAFEGPDTKRMNPLVVYPPQQASRGIHHIHRGRVREAPPPGLFAGHVRGPQGNVVLARSVSCLSFRACRNRPGARASPEAPASRQTDRVPLSPFPPDTCMIALICPDSIQPGVPLELKCQTSVTRRLPHAD